MDIQYPHQAYYNPITMTYNDFQKLSEKEKSDRLWHNGKPVARSVRAGSSFILFQLDAFYVEVEYKEDFVEIVRLKVFETPDLPTEYLAQISISGLDH